MEVKDVESVRVYLMHGAYMVEGAETSIDMLSTVTLQLSQMQKLPKPVIWYKWMKQIDSVLPSDKFSKQTSKMLCKHMSLLFQLWS